MQKAIPRADQWLKVDSEKGLFQVSRKVFVDLDVLQLERERIFKRCWLYLGHESEIPNPGDFKTRKVGGRHIIFNRDDDGKIHAFLNTCTHRGALVCREREGCAKIFQCFYHAWTFNNKGELIGQPGAREGAFSPEFNSDGSMNLKEIPRIESYRGFVFINFDRHAMPLVDYLGNVKEYLDLVVDQAEMGMEVVGGEQRYSIRANWKLLVENSADGYHGLPTHQTYFEYLKERGSELSDEGVVGYGKDLGQGHGVIEYTAPWGRPIAKWIPAWGEDGKRELEEIRNKLIQRFGEERADRICFKNRNIIVFPNLIINDIMAITIRTFDPVTPDYMEVRAWALAPKEETEKFRERRLFNFLEFLGPGGFATPDDVEALELCQEGFSNNSEVEWNDISKGMLRDIPETTDEEQMRAFWRQWNRLMTED